MQPRWLLSHARGYIELGLLAEAAAELDQLPAGSANGDEVLGLRLIILRELGHWIELCTVAAELVRRQPANAGAWITFAYATRRARSLSEAEAILREAELRHPAEATIQFNLGCYACQRGDLAEARARVDAAIALEHAFRDERGKAEGALEVKVHYLVEQIFGHRMAWHARAHAGIVDENVDAAECVPCGIGEAFSLIPVGQVRCDCERPASELPNVFGGGLACIQLAACDYDVCPAFRECADHLQAKTAAAACDKRDPA